MKVLYFHQHFSTPKGSAGIRSYEMARALVARGHEVTMVCGSYGAGKTGLGAPFERGVRRGAVDGIEIVEFDLRYSNRDRFIRRALTFLKFALRSTWLKHHTLQWSHDVTVVETTAACGARRGK